MNIIILGAPGAGKGTQAKKLAKELGLYHLSTGDLSRKLAKEDPRIDEMINKKGQLIPEEEMNGYVSSFIKENIANPENILFEGYHRYVNQYKYLEKWLSERGLEVKKVFLLDISEKETIKRLSARRMDKKTGKIYNLITNPPGKDVKKEDLFQRKDDTPEVIKKRLVEYRKNTLPMVKYIEKKGKLERINGERSIDEIFNDLLSRLKSERRN